jgi:hypothetical protein
VCASFSELRRRNELLKLPLYESQAPIQLAICAVQTRNTHRPLFNGRRSQPIAEQAPSELTPQITVHCGASPSNAHSTRVEQLAPIEPAENLHQRIVW